MKPIRIYLILILSSVLSVSWTNPATNSETIFASIEPVILNVIIPDNAWNLPIVKNNDLLYASTPVVISVSAISSGMQKIGSEIDLLLTADEAGYTFEDSSTINYVPFSESNITVTDLGTGNYYLKYLVLEGDSNVTTGNLKIKLFLSDSEGNMSDAYTSLISNNISIDADRPQISRAYISSADENIKIGETVQITVEADNSGYTVSPATHVNNVFITEQNLSYADLGNGIYRFLYTVKEGENNVSAGDLGIKIVLIDSYGNVSSEFTALDPNTVTIYTTRPSAAISGSTSICKGDSALITINLSGTPPWEIILYDGKTYKTISNILVSTYLLYIHPAINTSYIITRVTDKTENTRTGQGSVVITVNPLPAVEIVNLLEVYDVESDSVVLEGSPVGGTFIGPGVSLSQPYTFYPYFAGTEASPHEIIYTYTNQNNCTNHDTARVYVIEATGTITFEKPVACFDDISFMITAENGSNAKGYFTIQPSLPGVLQNIGNNQAILKPSLFHLTEDLNTIITHTYLDTMGIILKLKKTLKIEKLDQAIITAPVDIEFCNNELPVKLNSNYPGKGIFTGDGVTGTDPEASYFNPSLANIGLNRIYFYYESDNACMVGDSIDITNYSAPLADFNVESTCIMPEGGDVRFVDRSDIYPDDPVTWSWDFGDQNSGTNNFSNASDPVHFYSIPDRKYITLIITSEKSCTDTSSKYIDLQPIPEADFIWSSECLTDDAILFQGNETLFGDDSIEQREWKFYDDNTTSFELFTDYLVPYSYDISGKYRVDYKIVTNYGCIDSVQKTIALIPTFYIADESYYQDFEDNPAGWTSVSLAGEGQQNSWNFGMINTAQFPYSAASGTSAWYTNLPQPEIIENSAVLTPCFNFEDVNRPVLMIDIKRSMDSIMEGTVLQYTKDHGKTWKNVGNVEEGGMNWYNSKQISNGPAGQSTGWTGVTPFTEDINWIPAAHHLDDLIDEKEVRFRIVYGSSGDNTIRNEGFAFDNFVIGQRTRLSVIEYFTNANEDQCLISDHIINNLANTLYKDAIDIQYHTDQPSPDKMNSDNPLPANVRGLYYGISKTPYAVIDGGTFDPFLNHYRNYDFTETLPDSSDIILRSLLSPDFNIDLEIIHLLPTVQINVSVRALKVIPKKELTLYTVILEREIKDPLYEGSNGVKEFENVARKILPDAGGITFNKAWVKGEIEVKTISWDEPFSYLNEDNISVIAFLQEYQTKEVLQAAKYHDEGNVTSYHSKIIIPDIPIYVFPNPAQEEIRVTFGSGFEIPLSLKIFNMSGILLLNKEISVFQTELIFNVEELEYGIYFIEISNINTQSILYRSKLIIL